MSVRGIGTDIASIERFTGILERTGERFLRRCFREGERQYIQGRGSGAAASAAARWAAKEAFLKALGCSVSRVPYQDVEVVREAGGAVKLRLHGKALALARTCGVGRTHLSLSHDGGLALALVVLETEEP